MNLFRYLHAYEEINRKLGCTLVSTTQPARYAQSRSLISVRERTDRQLDMLGRGTPGRRPSSLKDEPAAESKPAVDVKDEVCFSCDFCHR